MRGFRPIDTLVQDLRYGVRMLRRNPGFTFVAVLTLALGIGANTAIFSMVNAVLLRSLPYRDPDRLIIVNPANGGDFLEWRDQARAFEQIGAYDTDTVDLIGGGEAERLPAGIVSADLFAMLGVAPALGRTFMPEEDMDGGPPVVILSDSLWRRRFGGDPQVIGRALKLRLSDHRIHEDQKRSVVATIVGIMPPGLRFPRESELWLPLALNVAQVLSRQNTDGVTVIARLKPSMTLEAARADLSVFLEAKRQAFPDVYSDIQFRVIGLSEWVVDDAGRRVPVGNVQLALLILFGAVTFVLLIASANVANLLLARSAARQKEMAIRAAVGAGRLRLVRQLLTESLLLSIIGGIAGLLLAKWCIKLLVAMSPAEIARIQESNVDGRVLGFTCIVVVLVSLIAGFIPALQASKVDVSETLKTQTTAGGARMWRSGHGGTGRMMPALMITELALALVLLAGAGLMIKSFLRLLAVPKGFNPDGVLTLALRPNNVKYPNTYIQEVLDRVRALPGIQSAALATTLPLEGSRNISSGTHLIEGRPPYKGRNEPFFDVICVSLEYFRTMGMQMRSGRPFTSQDGAGAPQVVIINEAFARRFFPKENPIGHRLLWRAPATIVGVVGDTRKFLDQDVPLEIYVPSRQHPSFYEDGGYIGYLVVQVAPGQNNPSSLSSLTGSIRNQMRAIEPNEPVLQIATMDEFLSKTVMWRRYLMLLLGVFAAVALIIATVGIYGVISYAVSQRTHEIGIRMALGAQTSDVLRMVIWRGMRLALIGVALGLAAALALTRVMKNQFFEVSATDPVTFAVIALLLIVVAFIASYIPARRATKVDPLEAIRHE
jgi:putative ABC transport system permease protein